jgi:quercetin dioxygenase-like cupin family protein
MNIQKRLFISLSNLPLADLPGGGFAAFVLTKNLTASYTDLKAGAEIPLHQHPEEAIDIVIHGILEMQVGETSGTLTNGMMSIVPLNVPPTAKAIIDCKAVTIFYPQRFL